MFETMLSNFNLEKIFWILKVKLKYIILVTILFAFMMGVYANYTRTSTYVAQISFYIYSNPDYITDKGININGPDLSLAEALVPSYMQIIRSNTFLNKLKEETGLIYSIEYLRKKITASAIVGTAAFTVSVYNPNPVDAMNIANAIGLLAQNEISRIVKSGGIQVLDMAVLPTVPYESTNIVKLVLIGGIGGFALSTLLFLIRGLLDTTVRKKSDVQDIFTIPLLGDVPQLLPLGKNKGINKILSQESPFALKESYNNIRANLLFTGRGEKCPIYTITSVDVAEGKTLNTINMAISYSQINKKTLVIDADMRKSSISTMLDLEQIDGLSEYLAGIVDLPFISEYQNNLFVISAGKIPPNPAELLSSNRFYKLLETFKKEYDVIFIDMPPACIVADALLLSKQATAYILIVRDKLTKLDREKMLVHKLEALGANICGFIYNGISMKAKDYTYKHYEKEYFN